MSRQYITFKEALKELRGELKQMGIRLHTRTFQNKFIGDDPNMETLELQNYTYTVTGDSYRGIPLKNASWCEEEFAERISREDLNPGEAWKLRRDTWKPFIRADGKFDYSYSQRIALSLDNVINALKKDPYTRRAFLPVFDAGEDSQDDFTSRVPCSLGYWFNFRQNRLNITYLQRSADFSEHFNNDLWLADRLKCYIAGEVGMAEGFFTHWVGSLHVFKKD